MWYLHLSTRFFPTLHVILRYFYSFLKVITCSLNLCATDRMSLVAQKCLAGIALYFGSYIMGLISPHRCTVKHVSHVIWKVRVNDFSISKDKVSFNVFVLNYQLFCCLLYWKYNRNVHQISFWSTDNNIILLHFKHREQMSNIIRHTWVILGEIDFRFQIALRGKKGYVYTAKDVQEIEDFGFVSTHRQTCMYFVTCIWRFVSLSQTPTLWSYKD